MKPRAENIATTWSTVDERFIPPHLTGGSKLGWSNSVNCSEKNNGDYVHPTNWSYLVLQKYGVHGFFTLTGTASFNMGLRIKTSGNLDYSGMPLPGWTILQDAVYNLALSNLHRKLRDNLDLSIAMGEAGKTQKMLSSMAKVLTSVKRMRPPRRITTQDAANWYLQFKYGVVPLLSDVYNAAAEAQATAITFISKIKARAKIPLEGISSLAVYSGVGNVPNVPFERTYTGGWKQSAFIACELGVTLGVPQSIHNLSRWTSLNPVSIAWELCPYSFVVDWVLDIGSYLRNLETALLYSSLFLGGYRSDLVRIDFEDRCEAYVAPVPDFEAKVFGAVATYRNVRFSRSALASYPFPQAPSFKVDLGSSQLGSAAALLRQLLARR